MEFESERFVSEETEKELLKNIGVKTEPKPEEAKADEQISSVIRSNAV